MIAFQKTIMLLKLFLKTTALFHLSFFLSITLIQTITKSYLLYRPMPLKSDPFSSEASKSTPSWLPTETIKQPPGQIPNPSWLFRSTFSLLPASLSFPNTAPCISLPCTQMQTKAELLCWHERFSLIWLQLSASSATTPSHGPSTKQHILLSSLSCFALCRPLGLENNLPFITFFFTL